MLSSLLALFILLAVVLAFLLWRDRLRPAPAKPGKSRPEILIDGSNAMHWKDNVPALETIRLVVRTAEDLGYMPGVIFDANAGYKLFGTWRGDRAMAAFLALPEAQVLVVPKGEPADRFLLTVSRRRGSPIVTNDRFRDWVEHFPEVSDPGRLIRGGFRAGRLWLDLDPAAPEGPATGARP